MNSFSSKKEAIAYLVNKTKFPKEECTKAYDFIVDLDLEKIK